MPAIQLTDRGTGATVSTESRDLTRAAVAALGAPSILDTQPWHWRIGHDAADLRTDRSRQLTTIDPTGRLLTISCGIALHHARTALDATGHHTDITYLPDDADPDLLATVRIAGTLTPTGDTVRLFRAIAARRGDRRPFDGRPVPDDTMRRLRTTAEHHGAHLHLPGSDHLIATAVEHLDPGDTAARYAFLSTDGDEPRDWLTAGEALSAVLLTATAHGLAAAILSDLVDAGSAGTTGHPVIVIGVGHPAGPHHTTPPSPRRTTHDSVDQQL